MTPLTLFKVREQAQHAAWDAFIAGRPMSWIAA